MQKNNLQFHDDVATVAGLKSTDRLLVIGDNVRFPGIQRYVDSVRSVASTNELLGMIKRNEAYERIFIARENVLDERLIRAAGALLANGGLICFFSEDQGLRAAFEECVSRNFLSYDLWPLLSNVGYLVATNARVDALD